MSNHKPECACIRCAAIAAGMTPEEAYESHLNHLKKLIEKIGVAVIGVGEDPEHGIPAFYYSIGLTELGHPEVIVFSLPIKAATSTVNRYFFEVKNGTITDKPQVIEEWFNVPVHIIEVDDDAAKHFGNQAFQYYKHTNPALTPKFVQMVLTDRNGVAAWEPGYEDHFVQPILNLSLMGSNSDDTAPDRVLH